jgi:HAMP domain-containing protein/CheY-like chemotaxis protein/signal transduction histidine kinase
MKNAARADVTRRKGRRPLDPSVPDDGRRPSNGQGRRRQFPVQLLDAMLRFRDGDYDVGLPTGLPGIEGRIADAFNEAIALSERRAREVTRVSRAVGREGRLRERMSVPGARGARADEVAEINALIDDLVWPTTEVTRAVGAVAKGDLGQYMALEVDGQPLAGEFLRSARLVNRMIDQLSVFTSEVTRVAREVGTEGKLGGQAQVKGASGVWKDLTESVNQMAGNLTAQVRSIADVTIAVANGDLSKKVTVDVRGEILQLKEAINTMVDQLRGFASEVTRVAREVGTEGRLGGQAVVPGAAGTWKDLTDSVNAMASNLTAQVRNIAAVTTAVARGDLSRKITVDVKGEILELKNTINTMVDQLNAFASEVSRVAREVGTEGKLGGRAVVPDVAGTWKDLTDSVNAMGANLTAQVRNIAEVTTAVANGDLSRKITVDVKGEILQLKDTINTMVDQLNAFASEVTRVAREVGTDGKLGGQAHVPGAAGTWKDLTDNVNSMASNLTGQVRNIAEIARAIARGDLSRKITVDVEGEVLELKNTINTMVDQLNAFASEVSRVAREVGSEGALGGQAVVPGVAGTWKDLTDNVNSMASNLTAQVRNIAEVTTAVARGDLSRKITVDVKGEILELKNTINTMVDQLNAFAAEVTRVAREVGTEGKLGGQAVVPGVAGTWKDLTDSVNVMAANLTDQVRGIVKVVTAVAEGELSQKLTVQAKGEIAALAGTINNMTDTLATFADQVTNVAREVGVEGRLGGQAHVPGADGTWKDLTGNVNLLAANLTNQVRAIAEVATAVTKGDLTRSIQVDARGEVADLKDNINTMIDNLRGTTERNQEQDWLKTNVAKFASLMQGQRDLVTVGRMLLGELAPLVHAQQGAVYHVQGPDNGADAPALVLLAGYAQGSDAPRSIRMGEGLVGQCALGKHRILLSRVPRGYLRVRSSLGVGRPASVVVLPVLFEGETKAVIELASLEPFTATHLTFLEQLTQSIGIVINTIEATMRTEDLLRQSQQLTLELQTRQTQLQSTNEELATKAKQLAEQNVEVERKNMEVEQARHALEEKAAELALTSKYKSEFLASMSHELRTPLNSILILGQQLADNAAGNLTPRQVDFARNIHSAGTDLLALINDVLDLSKIESGTVTVEAETVTFASLRDGMERTFHHVAESRSLRFDIEIDGSLPDALTTDPKRLQQILKNLLSNAFKFTSHGRVALAVRPVAEGWSPDHPVLRSAASVVAFTVTDTGIGIPPDKQRLIFEAFQQADAGTSRKYGGTGLGLAISRELASLLGGEIRLASRPGEGSTFTLYVPLWYAGPARPAKPPAGRADVAGDAAPRTALAVAHVEEPIADDRHELEAGDASLLIVEDDAQYARILLELARKRGFKGIVATRGQTALSLAREYRPTAITLDVFLPDMLGWTVLNNLKLDPVTRHIPVQILSMEEERQLGLAHGAFGCLVKPATTTELEHALERIRSFVARNPRRLLVVEDDDRERESIVSLLGHDDIEITAVGSGRAALDALAGPPFDCCVVDLRLPDMSGFELLQAMQAGMALREVPVVVFTGQELSEPEEARLRSLAKSIVLKDVQSPERLFDQTALFLHRSLGALPPEKRGLVERLHGSNDILRHRKVLVVDDDVRNIFALTTILENHQMQVVAALNGREAINLLEQAPDVDAVLLDVMMPGMDGFATLREIRKTPRFRSLPILVLTAKAMKGDRERCMEAGASDYIAKPVNTDQLLSLLRAWLHR